MPAYLESTEMPFEVVVLPSELERPNEQVSHLRNDFQRIWMPSMLV